MEPRILTLKLDDASQAFFDRLREAHFPPERNLLQAHLTMFHKLPGEHEREILSDVEEACNQEPIQLTATNLRFLGKGVAYELASPELEGLRRSLAATWKPWLGPQDLQGFKPHVTVQNKVDPKTARTLHEELSAAFAPFEVRGVGLSLWRYVGGPWEAIDTRSFGEH